MWRFLFWFSCFYLASFYKGFEIIYRKYIFCLLEPERKNKIKLTGVGKQKFIGEAVPQVLSD